jgi:8-amino-7-oxononanoate synthase
MGSFEDELLRRLQLLEEQNLRRRLRPISSPQQPHTLLGGQEVLNFSSNDYLGLANHSKLKSAAAVAVEKYGTGSGASRLISGSLQIHHDLEDSLAAFKGTEAALVFSSGYAAALGTLPALISKDDIVILDKLVHASMVDSARLSGAKLRIFAHNDLADLEEILKWCSRQPTGKPWIVTESLFSMDGDFAPLPALVELKEKYGAALMVDEAHATGLFGPERRGMIEQFNLDGRIEIQMGTLGKAIGSAGGYIAGSRVLVDYLINKARTFIFSTAPVPALSAAAQAGVELIRSSEGKAQLQRLRGNLSTFSESLRSPIFPLIIGGESSALEVAAALLKRGIFVPAVRYPTVARNSARLRITFSAAHQAADICALRNALDECSRIAQIATSEVTEDPLFSSVPAGGDRLD